MDVHLRDFRDSDIPIMREVLYEAVFWRASADRPTFEEGLALPEVAKSITDFGGRRGDTAVIATVGSAPIGASWFRYWSDDDFINGYVDESTPVLVVGVHRDYRRRGVGGRMISRLIERASTQAIQRISLSVSKDNHAITLYRQQGFVECADTGDALLMVRAVDTE